MTKSPPASSTPAAEMWAALKAARVSAIATAEARARGIAYSTWTKTCQGRREHPESVEVIEKYYKHLKPSK